MKAVELYFKCGGSPAAVRRVLGYPTKNTIKQWAREFRATGALHERCRHVFVCPLYTVVLANHLLHNSLGQTQCD
jgi:hypothetical protein